MHTSRHDQHPIAIRGPAGSINVDDGGTDGIPVVFAHSFAGNTDHWTGQLEHLRSNRRAVAFDFRGHGQSDRPGSANAYGVIALAADIGAVVDSLELERFVLVGHSIGGAAALTYAGAFPDRVAGLVLVGTPGKSPPEQAKQVMAALEADYDNTMSGYWHKLLVNARPETTARIEREMLSVPRDDAMAIIRAAFMYDPTELLRVYRGPVLIVDTPQRDTPGSLHRLAPHAQRRVVKQTSHWVQLDKPDEFNRLLDDFLASVR